MLCALLCGALVATGALDALAQAPLVTTVVDPCVPIDRAQLDRLLSIELGTSADVAASSPGSTHVHVRCVSAGIELDLQDAVTRKGMVRVLSRDSFRDASSTRLLALAIAEFVVASWVELRLPQKVEPIGPPPSPAAREAAELRAAERVQPARARAAAPSRTTLGVFGHLETWSEQRDVMLGLGLRLVHAPLSSIAISVAGDFAADGIDSALGDVTLRTFALSVAGLGRIELPPLVLLTGPGARVGLAQLSATPDDPERTEASAFYAPYGGLFWLGRAELGIARGLALTLDLELGAATLPVRALVREAPVVALDGVWLRAGLGLSLEL